MTQKSSSTSAAPNNGGGAPASGNMASGGGNASTSGGANNTSSGATSSGGKTVSSHGSNPFIALAQKAGVTPKHAGVTKPAQEAVMSFDAEGLEIDVPKTQRTASANAEEFGEEIQDDSAPPTDGSEEVIAEDTRRNKKAAEQTDEDQASTEEDAAEDENQEEQPEQTPQKKGQKYDLNQLEPEDRKFAKMMHNSAVKHFADKVKNLRAEIANRDLQLKQVEDGGLPLSYYNHPEAYQLHPEYRTVSDNISYGEKEVRFWEKQLINIENSQPFHVYEGVDANGQDIIKGPYQPNPSAKIAVLRAMNQVSHAVTSERVKLQQLQQSFKTEFGKGQAVIDSNIKQQFGWMDKPEIQKEQLTFRDSAGKPVQMTVADAEKAFYDNYPQVYRDHPSTKAAAKLFVATKVLQHLLQKERAERKRVDITNKTAELAEPSSSAETVTTTSRKNNRLVTIGGKKMPDMEFKFNPNQF